jgi:predicted DNA binding CopG/RHH family protein
MSSKLSMQKSKKNKLNSFSVDSDQSSYAKGEWVSSSEASSKTAVRAFDKVKSELKSQAVNMKFNPSDLEVLKQMASADGLSYQTLIGSIVHKYITKRFVDIEELRKLYPEFKFKKAS